MIWGYCIDAGILLFLVLHSFLGWRRGLMWQAAGGLSVGLGVILGLMLSPAAGEYAQQYVTSNPLHARLIGFLLIFGLVGFTLRIVAACFVVQSEKGVPKEERARRLAKDRILGGVFGALKGLVLAAILIAASVAFFPHGTAWKNSHLTNPLAIAGARLLPQGAVQEMRDWAKLHVANIN